MNSLKLWLTLRVHGREGYEELINRQLSLAKSFVSWVEASQEFELAVPQILPIVTFRLKSGSLSPQQLTAAHGNIVDEVTRDGRPLSESKRVTLRAGEESVVEFGSLEFVQTAGR